MLRWAWHASIAPTLCCKVPQRWDMKRGTALGARKGARNLHRALPDVAGPRVRGCLMPSGEHSHDWRAQVSDARSHKLARSCQRQPGHRAREGLDGAAEVAVGAVGGDVVCVIDDAHIGGVGDEDGGLG